MTDAILQTGPTELSHQLASKLARVEQTEDTDELLRMLADTSAGIATELRVAAAIIRKLESKGVNVLREFPQFALLRKVAYGEVLPELYERLCGRPELLRRAAALPLDDQRRIVDDEPLEVVGKNGAIERIAPSQMSGPQARRALVSGRIRPAREQVTDQHSSIDQNCARVDRDARVVHITAPTTLNLEDLLFYANEICGFIEIDPSKPCRDVPGSFRKLLTLIERYRCGHPLFHPGDSGYERNATGDDEDECDESLEDEDSLPRKETGT